jgi:hypothetical protein
MKVVILCQGRKKAPATKGDKPLTDCAKCKLPEPKTHWERGEVWRDIMWPVIHATYDLWFKQGKPGVLVPCTTGESLPGAARFSDTKVTKTSKPATKAPKKAAKKKAAHISRGTGKDDKNTEGTTNCKKCKLP